ncbi:hypothetical protein Fmac_015682 [Flemingia macrophylla]|uniref:R13L1/DRL21-like LRR repeat region domain-containing protein n=1 Tax=Flemingia macrophylla TaxID=520843 RepID=A0ABD1MF87_9FABA
MNLSEALTVDLENKTHLARLELIWDGNCIPDDLGREKKVVKNLQPSKHLKDLSIYNYGGTQLPSWLSTLNVVSMSLEKCKYCFLLPPFGVQLFLKKLRIRMFDGTVSIGVDFYGSIFSSFTSLETLELSDMKEWEKWECQATAFSRLQNLCLSRCPKLKALSEQLLQVK